MAINRHSRPVQESPFSAGRIDVLVYALYGLTDEEIAFVEEAISR